MATDLREKLRQLGVTKGAGHIKPPSRQTRTTRSIESLLNGQEVETEMGRAFVVVQRYAPGYLHGGEALVAPREQSADVAARLGRDPALAKADLSRAVFLDTETTGLAGGTGTLVFLVGIGSFEGEVFCLRQFFLRDPDEETALLAALAEQMDDRSALVTFNGRGFDVPLLQARYVLTRMHPAWLALPHLDLLLPARRIWRGRLSSCALASLEMHVLGVQRDQADVPSYLIPQMYLDYLRTGDASEMPRVMYHNAQDILSLVTLAVRLCRIFADPLADAALDPADLVSLGKWYDDLGMSAEAERAFRAALERSVNPSLYLAALARLGLMLKQQGRRAEAAAVWEQLARSDDSSVLAHIELAKYFEWHVQDLHRALMWTQTALRLVAAWPPGYVRDRMEEELAHRLQRLKAKSRQAVRRD